MLASFLSLRAVGSQLMSTSRPMALCRATDDHPRPVTVQSGRVTPGPAQDGDP